MSSRWRYAAAFAVFVLCVFACAFGAILQDHTIVRWVVPVCVAVGAGVVTVPVGFRMWKWLTGSSGVTVNALCHVVIIGCLVYPGFLAANMYLADEASEHVETVTVVGKYTEKHDTHRRLRRHTYVKSGVRYTYHIDVEFTDGTTKRISVQKPAYSHYRKGRTYDFVMRKGLFGFPVIKDMG